MNKGEWITARRLAIWRRYHQELEPLERAGRVRRPVIPQDCEHNAHMYYLLLRDLEDRAGFIEAMKEGGVNCVSHYVPLHSSPFGKRFGRTLGELTVTMDLSDSIVRLPLWLGMDRFQSSVVKAAIESCAHDS